MTSDVTSSTNVGGIAAQLRTIRQQTLSSILCKTMEDEPDNPNMALTFQRHVLMLTKEKAEAVLRYDVLSKI